MDNLRGRTLKGYQLLERLGSGSFSAVYHALQPGVGREVAVKVIAPEVAGQPDFIRRFEIEAQLIARLEHLHIVPLYDFWRDPNGAYLVTRWLRGGSLAQALEEGPLDLRDAVRLVDQVARGLAAAHNHRVVHQNLKPSNILFDQEGNAYLSDFDIALDEPRLRQRTGTKELRPGPANYLSPEQANGAAATPRSDLYSLGVILYEALTGAHPRAGLRSSERTSRSLEEPIPTIETLNPDTAGAVNQVIQTATAGDPGKRYADALEMAAAFRQAARPGEAQESVRIEETLTLREREILLHIVEGQTNKQIARDLFVELPTVKWHITQLYRKLGVRSRSQAVIRAREFDLIKPETVARQKEGETSAAASFAPLEPANPYKGLRPFTPADSRDFFGREALVENLLNRLRETGPGARFLAVLGPSGGGKSSLLRAGLIPAIWSGTLPGSERWFVAEMAPGARPLDELEVALTRLAADQAGDLHKHLSRDAGGLLRVANLILPDDSELLLVIDQFEELFTLMPDPALRERFLNLILEAVTAPRSRVRVIVALRADFFDRPLHYPHFGQLLRSRMETLLPLSAEELERTILRPAAQVGVTLEPGLPARIIAEVLGRPGGLPLLQYALTELFESRDGRVMNREAYERLGGAVGALALRADEVLSGLGDAGGEAARQMFLRLVSVGQAPEDRSQAPDTSRGVARAELLALAEDPDLMEEVIDTFGAYRLLTLDHDSASRQPTVKLAHEALIGEWPRLGEWVRESRGDLDQHRRLQALANEWEAAGQDPGYLLRGARLDRFASWAAETTLVLTPDEAGFLAESLWARDTRREEEDRRRQRELETAQQLAETERLRAEEQTQANRRLRWLAAGLALLLITALGAAWFARSESLRAEAQARTAFARELAAASVGNLAVDPELSLHLALQAVEATYAQDGFVLPVAEEALHLALQGSRVILTVPQGGGAAFSPDGIHLVTGGADGTISVWDAGTGEMRRTFGGHVAAITDVAFSPDGWLLATASADHHRILRDFATGRPILDLPGMEAGDSSAGLSSLDFSPDGQYLLSTAQFAEAGILEVASGREVLHFDASAGPTAAFSPDGRSLALMTAVWAYPEELEVQAGRKPGPEVLHWQDRLFDYADPAIEFRATSSDLESAFHEPGSVSYSPDGARLLTTVVSSLAVMRDAHTGEPLFTLSGHTGVINGTAFGPGGSVVATASADGTARLWNADTGDKILILEGHQNEVVQVAFSPSGSHLATSSLDGTTKIWDLSPGGRGEWPSPMAHLGVVSLAFNPQEPHLVTLGVDGVLNHQNVENGAANFTLGSSRDAFPIVPAFSPDGKTLAFTDPEGNVQVIEALSGSSLGSLPSDRTLSTLALSPEGDLLAAGSENGFLKICKLDSGEVLGEWVVQDGFVNGLVFSRDGERLAVAGAEGEVLVIDLQRLLQNGRGVAGEPLPERAILHTLTGHTDVIPRLGLSPDGSMLITASWDGTARVWDFARGELLMTLAGHRGRVWHAAFSPDGQRIATAGADGQLILWSAETGEEVFVLRNQTEEIRSLAFSHNGKYLAAGDADGTVRIYVMPVEDLLALAQKRLTRQLTEEECRRYLHSAQCP